jgi:hypothetical protein
MTIPIEHEDAECVRHWPTLMEQCVFCDVETRWWNRERNKPVCPICAKEYSMTHLDQLEKNQAAAVATLKEVWQML